LELTGSKRQVLAHAAGVKEVNFVRLRPGDPVMVAVSEQDPTRGRIVSVRPGR
jgi:translation initiation factor IF-1